MVFSVRSHYKLNKFSLKNGTVTIQKITRVSEKTFRGNININSSSDGKHFLIILTNTDHTDNMPEGIAYFKLAISPVSASLCTMMDSTVSKSRNIQFTKTHFPPINVVKEIANTFETNLIFHDVEVIHINKCEVSVLCESIEIIVPDTVCVNATFTMIARKNQGCSREIEIETSVGIQIISKENDSTFICQMLESGEQWIRATLYNCTITNQQSISGTNGKQTKLLLPLNDTTVCKGDSIIVNAPSGYQNYSWNEGISSEPTITISDSGRYYLEAENSCGIRFIDSIIVQHDLSRLKIIAPTNLVCLGNTIKFYYEADLSISEFTIQPSLTVDVFDSQNQIIAWPEFSTTYYLNAISSIGCTLKDSVSIHVSEPPEIESNYQKVYTICENDSISIQLNKTYPRYLWSNGETTRATTINKPGKYFLEIFNENDCVSRADFEIQNKDCFDKIYFPNIFSPNGDGLNDQFNGLTTIDKVENFELTIYNRWGKNVFKTNTITKGWDGYFNGQRQSSGVYVWVSTYKLKGQLERIEKGTVNLIR